MIKLYMNSDYKIIIEREIMNILHIMKDYIPNTGGSVVRNSNMLEPYSRTYDDRIYVLNLDGDKYEPFSVINNIEIFRCKTLLEMITKAIKLIKEKKIDIIHGHNYRFLFVSFISNLLSRRNKKIVMELHALYYMSKIKQIISYWLLKRVDLIIVLAESAKTYLIREHNIIPDKIRVIRNGISLESNLAKENCELVDRVRLLHNNYCIAAYTGSFFDWQGVLFVAENIDALLKKIDKLAIIMVGDGPQFGEVMSILQNSKYSERIILHKSITKMQMNSLTDYIDLVLIPREKNLSTNTAVPLKAIEAMMQNKCIIAGDDDGLAELLNKNNAGIFESGNINDMLQKMKVLVNDKNLRSHLGQQAKSDAQKVLESWEKNVEKMYMFYREL